MADIISQPISFTPSGKTTNNRLWKVIYLPPCQACMHELIWIVSQSAMTERLCTWDDTNWDVCGQPTKEYLRLYQEWGQGGIGVIVLGNIPIDRRMFSPTRFSNRYTDTSPRIP
jgi:hypothetical protein